MSHIIPLSRIVGNPHKNATVKSLRILACLTLLLGAATAMRGAAPVHIWEKQELTLTAARSYANPYTRRHRLGRPHWPGFNKRVYGFWDGGTGFHVRVLATAPGAWPWRSGSSARRPGPAGKSGSFTAIPWTEAGEASRTRYGAASCGPPPTATRSSMPTARRSSSSATPGIPPAPTVSNGTTTTSERPIGPAAGFKDYVRYRKRRATTGSTSSPHSRTGRPTASPGTS